MPFPDLSLYVPVVCETDSKYAGKCYMEKISAVQTLNGNPVSKETDLKKSISRQGMYSTLQIQGIKQTRLRLNKTHLTARLHAWRLLKTRLALRLNAFSRASKRVSRLQYTFSI